MEPGSCCTETEGGELGSHGGAHHIAVVAQRSKGGRGRDLCAGLWLSATSLVWSEAAEDQAVSSPRCPGLICHGPWCRKWGSSSPVPAELYPPLLVPFTHLPCFTIVPAGLRWPGGLRRQTSVTAAACVSFTHRRPGMAAVCGRVLCGRHNLA